MKSRITFTVEHDEDTDALQAFAEGVDDQAIWMFDEVSYEVEVDVE